MKRLSPILRTPASSNVAFWAENEHAAFRNLGRAPDSGPVPGTAESQVAAVDPKEAEELQDQLNQVENQIKELEEIKNEILMRLSELGAQSAGSSSRGSKTTVTRLRLIPKLSFHFTLDGQSRYVCRARVSLVAGAPTGAPAKVSYCW